MPHERFIAGLAVTAGALVFGSALRQTATLGRDVAALPTQARTVVGWAPSDSEFRGRCGDGALRPSDARVS